jgi:hypothetical protein
MPQLSGEKLQKVERALLRPLSERATERPFHPHYFETLGLLNSSQCFLPGFRAGVNGRQDFDRKLLARL